MVSFSGQFSDYSHRLSPREYFWEDLICFQAPVISQDRSLSQFNKVQIRSTFSISKWFAKLLTKLTVHFISSRGFRRESVECMSKSTSHRHTKIYVQVLFWYSETKDTILYLNTSISNPMSFYHTHSPNCKCLSSRVNIPLKSRNSSADTSAPKFQKHYHALVCKQSNNWKRNRCQYFTQTI